MKLSKQLKRAKTGAEYDRIMYNAVRAKKTPNLGRLQELVKRPTAN
jgi:hypothetical protein